MARLQPDQVLQLWLLLLILAPGREQSRALPKPAVLLHPPWSTAFKGETVALTCLVPHSLAPGDISWYKDKKELRNTSEKITVKMPGSYQCKTQGSSLSNPVNVGFFSEKLILQVSHPVIEGDNAVLRCLGKGEEATKTKTFYKDGKQFQSSLDNITLNSVFEDHSEYQCDIDRKNLLEYLWPIKSNKLRIQVQELFSQPVLTASPFQPTEGGPLNLTCETQLTLYKSDVQLQFRFFRNTQILGSGWSLSPELRVPTIWKEDSSWYRCEAKTKTSSNMRRSPRSWILVQRVPVSGVTLEVQPPGEQLAEGRDLVLTCSVATGTGTVTFSWHREGTVLLGRKIQRSQVAELRVPSVTEQDSGRYYCAADNSKGPILSTRIRVTVKVPASGPVLTLRAPGAQAVVGDKVELHCEALRGSPPILYQFYHEDVVLGSSLAPSGGGASFNFSLTDEHSGNYSCEANNSLGAWRSDTVTLSVKVPASRPVLTLRAPGAQAVVGDEVELHCEAPKGSPPILYRFYHKDVVLGNSSAPSGGGASFNLSLTEEHSGNYSCEAENGLGAQLSDVVTLNIAGTSRSIAGRATAGVFGGLLGILGLSAVVLLRLGRTQGKAGGLAATRTPGFSPTEYQGPSLSEFSNIDPQEPTQSERPTLMELQPVYYNVNSGENDPVYCQIRSIRHTQDFSANPSRMPPQNEAPAVIYSELKKVRTHGFAEQADSSGGDLDAAENYENVPCAPAASNY